MGTQLSTAQAERSIAALADGQYGVVSRAQLLDAGLSSKQIGSRVRGGLLIGLHRGVYAVGHRRLTRDGAWMAAVLATGPPSFVSHRDAATLHQIGHWTFGPVAVTTTRRVASTPALRVHDQRRLHPDDVTTVAGIPVTSVARTLVDLAGVLSQDRLARVCTEAERAHAFDLTSVVRAAERTRGRHGPGARRLRAVLGDMASHGAELTRSPLERRFRRLVREHGLPRPRLNALVEGEEVDALWARRAVIAELDGWETHRTRAAFARDREKDARLAGLGYVVLRFAHAHVADRPAWVAERIRAALAHGGAGADGRGGPAGAAARAS